MGRPLKLEAVGASGSWRFAMIFFPSLVIYNFLMGREGDVEVIIFDQV